MRRPQPAGSALLTRGRALLAAATPVLLAASALAGGGPGFAALLATEVPIDVPASVAIARDPHLALIPPPAAPDGPAPADERLAPPTVPLVSPQAQVYGPVVPVGQTMPPGVRPPGIGQPLFDAVERATATYPSVAAGRATIRATDADLRAARWQRFPSLSVEAFAFGGENKQVTSTVALDQPIWAGGRIGAAIHRAKASGVASRAQLDETVLTVALRISDAYYDMARAAERQAILEDSLAEHRRLVDSIARRVGQEVSPRADLELAQSRAAQVEQDLNDVTAQRAAVTQRFLELVGDDGYDPGAVPRYDPALYHPSASGALEEAVTCNPTRRRLAGTALVARADAEAARAAYMPQLSAQLSHNEVVGTRAGVVLRAQTGGGFAQFAAADAARARQTASELAVAAAEREIRETVAADLATNAAGRRNAAAGAVAARAAEAVTQSYLRQFIAGRRTWLDVMNAVREAASAQLARSDAEIDAMVSTARVLLNTCRWQPRGAGGS